MRDLSRLLDTLDAQAPLALRHLWLLDLLGWIRGNGRSAAASVGRVQLLIDALHARPEVLARFRQWWLVLNQTVDSTMVLADYGFAQRSGFFSEAVARLRRKLLPQTPETLDAGELFGMALPGPFDQDWIQALDQTTLLRLSQVLSLPGNAVGPSAERPTADGSVPAHAHSVELLGLTQWQEELLRALVYCTSHIQADGFTPELRLRMSKATLQTQPFAVLSTRVQEFLQTYRAAPRNAAALDHAAQALRVQLDLCRQAGATVYAHLDEHGISVNLVFVVRQLRARVLRARQLMDCLLATTPEASAVRLLERLVQAGRDSRSLRTLVSANASLLAAKVTERSAETGEHYITRDRAEYHSMVVKASGGGAITAVTTWLKFGVLGLGLAGIWSGVGVALLYAVSFVVMQVVHATLATKQPAMTAPAMAAKLKHWGQSGAMDDFVDEVTHLVRSQVAAVVGNVALVALGVVLISWLLQWLTGAPMIDSAQADYVFDSLSLLHPSTIIFAVVTGFVLFASSLIAGAVENWFVLRRLDSALRYNPRITAVLGAARAERWSYYWRANISGFASNISLGFMLGLLPTVTEFLGISVNAYHVTLSSGQIAAAAASLGSQVWSHAPFWWSAASISFIGLLNLSVSFFLALQLAERAHNVSRRDRSMVLRSIAQRMRQQPLSFFWPPKEAPATAKAQPFVPADLQQHEQDPHE